MEQIMSRVGLVDILFFVFIFFGLLMGFVKGFSKQFAKLLNLFISMTVALALYERTAQMIYQSTMVRLEIAESITIVALFFVSLFIFKIMFVLLSKIVSLEFVYFIERVFGSLSGGLRYGLLFCFLSYIVLLWPSEVIRPYYEEKSYSGQVVVAVTPFMKERIEPFRQAIDSRFFGVSQTSPQEVIPRTNV